MEASSDGFYLGFPCHKCREPIEIIIADATDDCKFVADDVLEILCPECGHRGGYQTHEVHRYPKKVKSFNSARR